MYSKLDKWKIKMMMMVMTPWSRILLEKLTAL
jgi:hypothetical protein